MTLQRRGGAMAKRGFLHRVSSWAWFVLHLTACDGLSADAPTPTASTTPPATAPAASASTAPSMWPGSVMNAVRRGVSMPDGDGTYRVDPFVAALIYDELREPTSDYVEAVAATESTPAGYRLRNFGAHPLLSQFGLRDGDIVVKANDVTLTNAQAVPQALTTASQQIALQVFRDDHRFVLNYRLAPGRAWGSIVGTKDSDDTPHAEAAVEPTGEILPSDQPAATPTPSEPSANTTDRPPSSTLPKKSTSPGDQALPPKHVTPGSSNKSGQTDSSRDVHCSTATDCTISRAEFRRLTASPERTRSEYKIVPAIRNDVHSGYKLKHVPASSTFGQLGFRADDKITHINGAYLADDAAALQLMASASSLSTFRIRFERGGAARTKTIVVR